MNIKIVASCRTRNEERNIAHFCNSYRFADKVLIADGGSEDDTIAIAQCYPNAKIREFSERVYSKNGPWRNPHGKHINFLIDWAKEEEADWIIFDDCDCRPNFYLRTDYRSIIQNSEKDFIYATRMYILGDDKYFPKLSKTPSGQWTPSLWAWKLNTDFRFDESNPWKMEFSFIPDKHKIMNLEHPYCLLHYGWPDEETIKRKMEFYNSIDEHPGLKHPLKLGGELKSLEDWMKE